MEKLIWKLRFTIHARKLLRVSWRGGWDMAESDLENINGDLSECPKSAAEDERDAWRECC